MNFNKLFTIAVAFLAVILAVSAVSAVDVTNADTKIFNNQSSVAHDAGSFSFSVNVSNSGAAGTASLSSSSLSPASTTISFSSSTTSTLSTGASEVVTATVTFPRNKQGTVSGNIVVTGTGSSIQTLPFSVSINNSYTYTLTKTAEVTSTQNGSLTLANTGNQQLSFALSATGAFNVSFSDASPTVSAGQSQTIIVFPIAGQTFGVGSTSVTVTASQLTAGNKSLTFTRTGSFCPIGRVTSNLTIRDVEISNDGDDDDTWKPLDTITIDVEVENTASNDIDDIIVEFGLFDENGKNIVSDLDFTNKDEEEFDLGDLDDGDDATATFEFKVPGDLENGRYTVIFKAYSDDASQSSMCTDSVADSKTESVKVENEDDEGKFIAFDNIVVSPTQATCGDTVTLSFDAVNIGEDDEDKVKISLAHRLLGVDQYVEISQGLDKGDAKMVSFNIVIPTIADGTYKLDVDAEYDYKNGVYRENLDDAEEIAISVFGCGVTSAPSGAVSISAELASDAQAGKQFEVTTTVKNNGNKAALFAVSVSGIDSWATLNDISENIVQLDAGASKQVTIALTPKSTATGDQSFSIDVRSEDGKTQSRQVQITVASSGLFSGNNWIWVLAAINALLIILIVVVAVIVSRR